MDSKGQKVKSNSSPGLWEASGKDESGQVRVHFLRRTAVLILRPAMGGWPAGDAVKVLADLGRRRRRKRKSHDIVVNIGF